MEADMISEDDMELKRIVDYGRLRVVNLKEPNPTARSFHWMLQDDLASERNARPTQTEVVVVYSNTSDAHASTNKTTNN